MPCGLRRLERNCSTTLYTFIFASMSIYSFFVFHFLFGANMHWCLFYFSIDVHRLLWELAFIHSLFFRLWLPSIDFIIYNANILLIYFQHCQMFVQDIWY